MAKSLKEEKILSIYSSNLPRAMGTAKIISKINGIKVHKSRLLREINPGKCEGLEQSEINKKFPEFIRMKKSNPFETAYPKGESYKDAQARVIKFLAKIREKNGTILVVGHQGFNRTLIGYLLGMDNSEMVKISVPHDAVYYLDPELKEIKYLKDDLIHNGFLKRGE